MKNKPIDLAKNLRRSAVALAVATCFSAQIAYANPTKPVVVNGAASFAQNGNLFTVTNSPNAIINWGSFSIGTNEITRFIQQSNASAVLNRVTGQNPSSILGALQSNGRVFLINPNGIVFGAGSQIDVGGLVASTLNLSNADFLAGRMRFTDGLGNSVLNQGNITTPQGGNVYLIGNAVTNNGLITSPKGDVILAAGNSVELVNPGTPNLRVEITAPDNEARNLGQIVADSGRIGIYAGLINHSGAINANSVEVDQSGQIILKATKNATLEAGSSTTANGPAGGSITVQSGDTTLVSGVVEAQGTQGKGGQVNVLGNRVGLTGNASVNVSGNTGGGTVLVGGDFQGTNPDVRNAFRTYVGKDATIKADALTNGNGGKVIVWSNDATRYYGSISAKGGAQSGNGGFVETSGKEYLEVRGSVNASAPKGSPGQWLLDPHDITIDTGVTTSGGTLPNFDAGADNAVVLDSDITGALSGGTSVTITTGNTGTQNGDITVAPTADLNWLTTDRGTTLTLNANRHINVQADISGTLSAGGGVGPTQIVLTAGGTVTVDSGKTVSYFGSDSAGGAGNVDVIVNANNINILGTLHAQTQTGNASVILRKSPGVPATSITVDGGALTANATISGSALIDLSSTGAVLVNNSTLTASGPTSAAVNLVTDTGNITLTSATVNATNFNSAGTTAITLKSNNGGNISIGNSIVKANGQGQTEIDISTTSGSGTIDITGSSVEAYGGGDAATPGAPSFVHVNAAGTVNLGAGTLIEAGAGSANPESTEVVIKSLNGNIASAAQVISEIEIGIPEVSGSTGSITLEALNGNISSGGGFLKVATNGIASLSHPGTITLKANSGIGATGAPIRIYDGFASVSATNGSGGGGIVLSQTIGDFSAAKLTTTNSSAGQMLDIQAEAASITVPAGATISNPNGPITLRAADFVAVFPASGPPAGNVQAGGDITLIANDMDLRGPVIANAGSGVINIQTTTPGRTIDFGPFTSGTVLSLDATDVSLLDAANIIFGLAANPTQISTAAITTTGAQTYNGPVSLLTNTTLSGTAISFNNTLQSPTISRTLTLNASGVTTFGGIVGGGGNPLASLTTDAAGSTAINGGTITTTGNQTYNDAVTLGATTTLSGTAIAFGNTLNGAQALTVNASGATTFGGAVGGVTPLTSLTADAGGNLTVGGPISSTGAVTLTGATGVNINSGIDAGGDILLDAQGASANVVIASNSNIRKLAGGDTTLTVRAANNITFSPFASVVSISGKFNVVLNSDRDASGVGAISLGSTSNLISSKGGDITLGGGANPLTTPARAGAGDIAGVLIRGAQLMSESGNINIRGQGPATAADNSGVRLDNGAGITTTTGNITIVGTGTAGSTEGGRGIRFDGAGTGISTSGGAISLTGTGGTGGLGNGVGVEISGGAAVGHVPSIFNITGTGGNGSGGDDIGIRVTDPGSRIFSFDGNINLTGTGGSATSGGGSRDYGIVVRNGAKVESSAGNITLNGVGGNSVGIGDNHGIYVEDAGSLIRTATGAVILGGTGRGQGSHNMGVLISTGAVVESTAGGAVTIIGSGSTTGTTNNEGVAIQDAGTKVASTTAAINITGTGGAGSASMNVAGGATINSTGGDILLKSLGGVIELGAVSGGVDLVSTGGNVTFDSMAGATQNATGKIVAGGLRLLGSGTFTLDQAANDITTLAANLTGTTGLTYRDANTVSIGTVLGTVGVNVTGPFTLNTSGAVSQTSPITVSGVSTINAGVGTIALNSGNDFQGPLALTGSNVTVNDINALQLGSSTVSGTLGVTSNGVIDQTGGSALNVGSTSSFNSTGNAITLANAGNDFGGAATLTGSNVSVNDANALTVVLNTTGTNTLAASGDIVASSSTNLTINSVSAGGNVSLASTGGNLNLNGSISSAGTLTTSAAGTQTLSSGTISAANYTLGGGGMTLAGGTLNISNLLTVQSGATLTNQFGATSAINAGNADISGILNPNSGTVAIANLNIKPGGLLKGVGTVGGNVNNDGTVSPGNSPGILTVTGNYVQGPTGVLNIDIGGTTAGSQYDQLQVGGTATLNGTLNTTLVSGFVPASSDVFNIIQSSLATSGTFSTTNNLPTTPGLAASYLSNGVDLVNAPVPPTGSVTGGLVATILIPSTELAPTGVLEQKDIFPSAGQGGTNAAGDKQPPVCN